MAYAYHDTASQVTLISDALKNELGLETNTDPNVKIRALADETVGSKGCTAFKNESLHTGEKSVIKDTLVVPQFSDNFRTFSHSVDVSALKQFKRTHVPAAPDRKCIDVLIRQSDKQLLTVLDVREGANPKEPNYVLTCFGPITSGSQIAAAISDFLSALLVQVDSYENAAREYAQL